MEPSQEDADFLIAFETTMILVEVKAFGHFTNKQINSKKGRWQLLKKQSELPGSNVTIHIMLMSRANPIKLKAPPDDLLPGKKKWPHAILNVHSPLQKLKVTGKNPTIGASQDDPNTWFIIPVPVDANDDPADEFAA